MRIVIISGTIFPHISARSFRTTELAKGLARMGHDVTVYAILGKYDYSSFEKEYHLTVKDLGASRCGNFNSDGIEGMSFVNRALRKLLYNVIDYPRCEYLFKTYAALRKESPFDLLITVAHPFGIHWGAAFFKKKHPGLFKKWISDCGDPFMGNPIETKRWRFPLEPMERFWCRQTDRITIPVAEGKDGYYKEFRDKISVIPQSIDFDSVKIGKYSGNAVPSFLFSGAVYKGQRDPREFLEYLSHLDRDFRFYVYSVTDDIFSDYIPALGERLILQRYIPRDELILRMSQMDFLVNINNNTSVQKPSKLIDYGLSKRPILNVSTHMSQQECDAFDAFLKGDYSARYVIPDFEQYDSKNVCRQFVETYNSLF